MGQKYWRLMRLFEIASYFVAASYRGGTPCGFLYKEISQGLARCSQHLSPNNFFRRILDTPAEITYPVPCILSILKSLLRMRIL